MRILRCRILLYPPTPLFGMHMLALLLFDLLLTLCGLILIRVAMIIVYDLVKNNLKSRKQHQLVLVYGLSEKSVSLVTRLQSSPHYKVVGFLTFGRRMKNHTIAECPVYYFENEYSIRYLRQRYDIDAVLFPTNEEAQTEQERLIRYCVESNLKILIAPPIDEVIDGKIMRQSIREIKIEDLLGRPEIKISLDEIRANFREKTVMVTGAAGSIGSEPFFLLKISTSPSTLDSETSPPVNPEKLLSGIVTILFTAIIWFAAPFVRIFAPKTSTFFRNFPNPVIETSSTVLFT